MRGIGIACLLSLLIWVALGLLWGKDLANVFRGAAYNTEKVESIDFEIRNSPFWSPGSTVNICLDSLKEELGQ